MESIPNLKAKIAGYLQRVESDYVVNDIDLLLDAINKAHQYAMLQHDFLFAEASVDVPVNLTSGARLSPALLHGTSDLITIKKVLRAWLGDGNSGYRPIDFTSQESKYSDANLRWRGVEFSRGRTFGDGDLSIYTPYVSQSGPYVYLFPSDANIVGSSPVSVMFDVIRWFPDYDDDDDSSDFLLQFGDDFLFWDSICRLNKLNKEFVTREEGNLSEPQKERESAWDDLLAWDAGLVYTADTSLNLD